MRFSIVGAGALGTILASHLIEAGHEVRVIARGLRAQNLRNQGLRVRGLRELVVPCSVHEKLDPSDDPGTLIYAVKTYHMDAALADAEGVRPQLVFSMANGVMKNDQLVDAFGQSRVLGCMANFSGELNRDGSVEFTRNVCLFLGGPDAATQALVETINSAGIICAYSSQIESVEWSKYVGWVALFALSVISRANTGTFLLNPAFAAVATRVIREAAAIADRRGIALIDQSPMPVKSISELRIDQAIAKVQEVGAEFHRSAPEHRLSALQDLLAGRQLEVHETLGYAVREADRLGVPVPTLSELYQICAGLNDLPR